MMPPSTSYLSLDGVNEDFTVAHLDFGIGIFCIKGGKLFFII